MTEQLNKGDSIRFRYHEKWRQLDNITDEGNGIVVGFEMRKDGQFSYAIKRFRKNEMTDVTLIEPPDRSGPVVGRP